eukprot:TRINITY_DN65397_c0_g1_i1.p1 TRINITY_DN65397_c0_g1~~TRINITY_DN65397_c0_g1_i1.p1  ORF type:complete len:376 (-),score=81.75 TRINITY_DN65397_c0_g1_i1:80-1207(-)
MLWFSVPAFLLANSLEILAVKVLGRLGVKLPQLVALLHCCGSVLVDSREAFAEAVPLLKAPLCILLGLLTAAHALCSAVALSALPGNLYSLLKVCEVPMGVAARSIVFKTLPGRSELSLAALSAAGAGMLLLSGKHGHRRHNQSEEDAAAVASASALAVLSSAISCLLPAIAELQLRSGKSEPDGSTDRRRKLGAQSFAVSVWSSVICLLFAVVEASELQRWSGVLFAAFGIVSSSAPADVEATRCLWFGGWPVASALLIVVAVAQHIVRLAREAIVLEHSATLFAMLKPLRQVIVVPTLVLLLGREAEYPGHIALPAYAACVVAALLVARESFSKMDKSSPSWAASSTLLSSRSTVVVTALALSMSAILSGSNC